MRLITIIAIFLAGMGTSVAQNLEIRLTTTGALFRQVAVLDIQNKTNHEESIHIPPLYLFDEELDQGIVVPFGQYVQIEPEGTKKIVLEGFHIFADRELLPAGKAYNWENLLKQSREIQRFKFEYDKMTELKGVRKLMGSELMPFDFVLLIPQDVDIFGYKLDHDLHRQLYAHLLLKQSRLLVEAYDRLHYAGKIITHFNNDPYLEKNIFVQNAVWICSAGLEGIPFKRVHIKREMRKYYKLLVGEVKKKDNSMIPSLNTYYKLYEQLGREAAVYLAPQELDARKPCLPPDFEFRANSLGVRSPMIATRRFDELPIRNQKAIDRNDCYPCVAEEETGNIVRAYLSSSFISDKMKATDDVLESITSAIFKYSPDFKQYFVNYKIELEEVRAFNFDSWLMDNNLTDNQVILEYYHDFFMRQLNKIDLRPDENEEFLENYLSLLSYLLNIYRNNHYPFSLDCCELFRQPQDYHYLAATELNRIFGRTIGFTKLFEKDTLNIDTLDEEQLKEHLKAKMALELLYKAYILNLEFFMSFSNELDKYYISGVEMTDKKRAEDYLTGEYDLDFRLHGEFKRDRIRFQLKDDKSLLIIFATSYCGEMRESHLPFIISPMLENPGSLVINEYDPVRVETRYGLSVNAGFVWPDMAGADKFNGGGADFIREQIDLFELNDTFNLLYPNYNIGEAVEIDFDRSTVYDLRFEYDLTDKLQVGLSVGYEKIRFGAFQHINYDNNQTDRGYLSGNITKINLRLSGRYYFAGEILRPFGGIGLGFGTFNNTFTKITFTHFEFQMKENDPESFYSIDPNVGLRFYPNQDFFVEVKGSVNVRFDKDINGENVTGFDPGFFGGFGMRF